MSFCSSLTPSFVYLKARSSGEDGPSDDEEEASDVVNEAEGEQNEPPALGSGDGDQGPPEEPAAIEDLYVYCLLCVSLQYTYRCDSINLSSMGWTPLISWLDPRSDAQRDEVLATLRRWYPERGI